MARLDIMAAEDIFLPNLGYLKGKTVLSIGTAVTSRKKIIPPEIMEQYRKVTIRMYIMFVKKLPLLMSISNDTKFSTY